VASVEGWEDGGGPVGGPIDGRYRLRLSAPAAADASSAVMEGPFQAVIVAAPAAEAARMVQGLDTELAQELGRISTVSAVTVSLGWRRQQVRHPLDGFGMVVPRGEGRRIMGVTWTSSKFPGRAPRDRVLLRAFLGGVKGPEVLELDDKEILDLVRAELDVLLGLRGAPELARLYRWPDAMPQYNVGHAARLARLEELQARHPGLVLAGGSYRGIGIPDCIQSGVEAAERVLAGGGFAAPRTPAPAPQER
jgi:protoporphyrinogen/coproporphyrinogen III oxidase